MSSHQQLNGPQLTKIMNARMKHTPQDFWKYSQIHGKFTDIKNSQKLNVPYF